MSERAADPPRQGAPTVAPAGARTDVDARDAQMAGGDMASQRAHTTGQDWMQGVTWRRVAIVAVALVGAVTLAMLPVEGASPRAMPALALAGFTVAMWATGAIPPALAAIGFMLVASAAGLAGTATVLSGFWSNAVWLVYGGLLIGAAAEKSGFGRWVARRFLARFQGSYSRLVLGILIGTSVLAFLVPANLGRIAIAVPIIMALAREIGYAPGSSGYVGLMITAVLGNFAIALGILPANLLNIMIVGTAEAMYGLTISYVRYLVMCLPVLGIMKGLLVWRLVPIIYPAPPPQTSAVTAAASGVLSAAGIRIAVILGVAIVLWATDFEHGIRPGWVAIGAGLACALPRIGILTARELIDTRRIELLVWVAGVMALSNVLAETGASTALSQWITQLAAADGKGPVYGSLAIAYLTSLLTNIATMGGTVPTMTAVVGGISQATGLPLEVGVLSISAGCSALWFPYVAAPMVVGLSIANVSLTRAARFTLVSSILTCILIIPANVLWWRVLGVLP